MKINALVDAFRRLSGPEVAAEHVNDASLGAKAPRLPPIAAEKLERITDTITVSSEAIFRFAAARFDPQRLTLARARDMFDLLYDGGAISERDRAILAKGLSPRGDGMRLDRPASEPRNLVAEFQGRLARDIGRGDVAASEANGRALAILGRLDAFRAEAQAQPEPEPAANRP
ncbi:MAG: hypothetical protein QF654_01500 [Alphaproteobacteria bacterium]|jgi:hypothetical protein|nr:hypothetical protein [Alphaproteobacteria bacterium]MDP6604230.1 hypothetical protein [Rhodospirillales bacterium]